jgi:hypothetical protein
LRDVCETTFQKMGESCPTAQRCTSGAGASRARRERSGRSGPRRPRSTRRNGDASHRVPVSMIQHNSELLCRLCSTVFDFWRFYRRYLCSMRPLFFGRLCASVCGAVSICGLTIGFIHRASASCAHRVSGRVDAYRPQVSCSD